LPFIKLDSDISLKVWNKYLKRYSSLYRCYVDEIGIWSIRCRNGFVQPYSIVKKELVAVLDFKSKKALTYFLKKLHKNNGNDYKISQIGDQDITITFCEDNIKKASVLFKFCRKKKISAELRNVLVERLEKARECRLK
jgi:hypothetical protein